MQTAIDTFTKFVNSPGGVLTAGVVLAGLVWKFFERVEAILTDQTKFELAVWLVGIDAGRKAERWSQTFATMFDRVFGERHFSLKCLLRSIIATGTVILLSVPVLVFVQTQILHRKISPRGLWIVVGYVFVCSTLPDYLSLLKSRYVIGRMNTAGPLSQFVWVILDLVLSFTSGACGFAVIYVVLLGVVGSHHGFSAATLIGEVRKTLPAYFENMFKTYCLSSNADAPFNQQISQLLRHTSPPCGQLYMQRQAYS